MLFCILHSTRFWFKRRGFAVINIDIISYLVVKKRDTSFQTMLGVPCLVAVPLSLKCERRDCEKWAKCCTNLSVGRNETSVGQR